MPNEDERRHSTYDDEGTSPLPCFHCGSTSTMAISQTISLCSDCGNVARVQARTSSCTLHIWEANPAVTAGEAGVREEFCQVCGEVRLVDPHSP